MFLPYKGGGGGGGGAASWSSDLDQIHKLFPPLLEGYIRNLTEIGPEVS